MDWFATLSVDGLVLTGSGSDGDVDLDRVIDVNPAAEKLFGRSRAELCGAPLDTLCSDGDREWIDELRRSLTGAARLSRVTVSLLQPEGAPRLCGLRVGAGTDDTGRQLRLWTFTPLELREGRQPLHLVMFDALQESILVLDDQLRLLAANRHAQQRLDQPVEALLGKPAGALMFKPLHEDGRPPEQKDLLAWRALQANTRIDAQRVPLRSHKGELRWADVSAVPFDFQIPGLQRGVIMSIIDHTESVLAAQRLEQSEKAAHAQAAMLNRLVASAPGLVHSFRLRRNEPGRFEFVSSCVEEILGLTEHDLMVQGRTLSEFIHPEDLATFIDATKRSAKELQPLRLTLRYLHPRRGELVLQIRSMPIRDDDGSIVWNGFVLDETDRQRAEEEVQRLNRELSQRVAERTAELEARSRELQATTQEMESFTYSVSHDLKAPLRGIDGYSRLLLQDHASSLNNEGRSFLLTIRRATRHMADLIDDLLAYSRIDRGRAALSPLDLQRCWADVVAERSAELDSPRLRLTTELGPCQVLGEREGLMLALRNLLDNAIKFSHHQPTQHIEIGSKAEAGRCLLWVRDNGLGFDMRYHDRIFEIFQRLQRAEDYPGTGVGLAIVRKAMERQGGRVWAQSAPGQGATFFLDLPLAEASGER
jgi:PAS domain S-box-containing protein